MMGLGTPGAGLGVLAWAHALLSSSGETTRQSSWDSEWGKDLSQPLWATECMGPEIHQILNNRTQHPGLLGHSLQRTQQQLGLLLEPLELCVARAVKVSLG